MPTPNPQRLLILTDLRKAAGLSLTQMARRCGLRGKQSHQTAGAWERGVYVPAESRRQRFIGYLWDDLGLRADPTRFEEIWAILVEEWNWASISDEEWRGFTNVVRPGAAQAEVEAEAKEGGGGAPFQGPAVTSYFVGREAELAEIERLLLEGSQPVALVGMGGLGKTTLAAQIAQRLRNRFADGVLWAGVAVSDPLDILASWAQAYGHDYSGLGDVESRAAAVRSLLAHKEVLIVLDDVGAPAPLKPLLPGSEHASVLLTTRSEDAAVSLQCHVVRPTELATADSLDLLAGMLGQARVDGEREAGAEVCNLLHNLPLAVEIAGQLLAARGRRRLDQLAARLRNAQSRLNLGIADRDVRTSFLVSWDTLEPKQRAAFSHMAVFAGRSFSARALADVLAADELAACDHLDDLAALSLVTLVEDGRYRQHPLLADFAAEMLAEPEQAWQRFAESQLAFAQAHQQEYDALRPEWDNLMAGMERACADEMWESVLAYADALAHAWHSGAHYQRARRGYGWAAEAAERLNDPERQAWQLCQLGRLCIEQDDFATAQASLVQARDLAASDTRAAGQSRYLLGRIAFERGEYGRAAVLLDEAEATFLHLEEGVDLALTYFHHAHVHYECGRFDEAERIAQFALEIQEVEQAHVDAMGTLRLLADVAIERNHLDDAGQLCQRALALGEQTGNRAETAATRYTLAVIRRKEGALDEAVDLLREAAAQIEPTGLLFMQTVVKMEESRIHLLQGALPAAKQTVLHVIQLLRMLGRPFNLVYALDIAGLVHRELGDASAASAYFEEALAFCDGSGHPYRSTILAHMRA